MEMEIEMEGGWTEPKDNERRRCAVGTAYFGKDRLLPSSPISRLFILLSLSLLFHFLSFPFYHYQNLTKLVS